MIYFIIFSSAITFSLWCIAICLFNAKDHSQYDLPVTLHNNNQESLSHQKQRQEITIGLEKVAKLKGSSAIDFWRHELDARGAAFKSGAKFMIVDEENVKGEWILSENSDPKNRILYIHGGAYISGSAMSQRPITTRLASISNAAIFAVNYSLMPENSRMAGIKDCRVAYEWILKNGPYNAEQTDFLIVAGDSSGGNLALSTVAWARDSNLPKANAVIVMSPQTDATYTSPSLLSNIDTDIMQGKSFGPIVKLPKAISLWMSLLMLRMAPNDPMVSPLLGNLKNLPPTLIQVSAQEMFLDDSVRYANKAISQKSKVTLQVWPATFHIWQAFDTTESDEAFNAIETFVKEYITHTEL